MCAAQAISEARIIGEAAEGDGYDEHNLLYLLKDHDESLLSMNWAVNLKATVISL